MTEKLFFLINKTIDDFLSQNKKFKNNTNYADTACNATVMLTAALVSSLLKNRPLSLKLELLEDLYNKQKEYLRYVEDEK